MIDQHYYTRDKRGIFSKTPGYDTVAKSKGLEDKFVINILHELCFYEAPAKLAGEENIFKYPSALFYTNAENKMIIGQSVFGGKDYTGQRNRYFTHSYIISEERKEYYIENPEKIIYSSGFVRNYDIEKGNMLPQIWNIELSGNCQHFNSIEQMFLAANMDRRIFINLIKACFQSVKYCKKIYIVLNEDYSDMNCIARGILKYLYRAIPFELRRNLGFITYMKEPKIKDLINIIFLAQGTIKRFSTEIKAGYVFDFSQENFYLEDIHDEKHEFIDFVMENIENVQELKKFFHKVDNTILKDKFDIYTYDSLFKETVNEKSKQGECISDKELSKEVLEVSSKKGKKHTVFKIIYEKFLMFLKG